MERCKRDGESMHNQGVLNADRISEFPEALILHILSLLSTKEAIATSVLSKKWQSLWKMLPNFKFKYCGESHDLEIFSKYVSKILLSHEDLVLQSLQLYIFSCSNTTNAMDTVIRTALVRNVRDLELEIPGRIWFRFPKSFYSCETLETLKLRFIGFMDVPCSVCLKSLRTLHLEDVDFEDEKSLINLLSGCPKLEDLMVEKNPSSSLMTLTITVPSLQRLALSNYSRTCGAGYVINAPCLKYLKIYLACFGFCLIENVTKLVEAKLIGCCLIERVFMPFGPRHTTCSDTINEKLMGSIVSVKRLSLNVTPTTTTVLCTSSNNIFHQLVFLELHTHEAGWRPLLSLMIDSSPKLQALTLIDTVGKTENPPDFREWKPKNVPECLLFHLKTFMWKGYVWKREDHNETAKYILSNTNRLKSATFLSRPMDLKERVEMTEDLTSVGVVRASNSCELLFEFSKCSYIY